MQAVCLDFGVAQDRDAGYDSDALRIGSLLIRSVRLVPETVGEAALGLDPLEGRFPLDIKNETERPPARRSVQSLDPTQTRTMELKMRTTQVRMTEDMLMAAKTA